MFYIEKSISTMQNLRSIHSKTFVIKTSDNIPTRFRYTYWTSTHKFQSKSFILKIGLMVVSIFEIDYKTTKLGHLCAWLTGLYQSPVRRRLKSRVNQLFPFNADAAQTSCVSTPFLVLLPHFILERKQTCFIYPPSPFFAFSDKIILDLLNNTFLKFVSGENLRYFSSLSFHVISNISPPWYPVSTNFQYVIDWRLFVWVQSVEESSIPIILINFFAEQINYYH